MSSIVGKNFKMTTLNLTVIWIGTVVILISFVMAILIPVYKRTYMKGFYFFCLISLSLSINTICGRYYILYNIKLFYFIQSVLTISTFIFWTLFFYKLIKDNFLKRIIHILFISTFSFLFYLIYFNTINKANLQILALINICLTIYCVLFYHYLFKNITFQNILLEPTFWIVAGLIFYSSISLPFYALNNYIKQEFPLVISANIFSISNMLIIIMHLFFIKAYLCTIRLHRV